MKSSMFWICYWWGSAANTMLLPKSHTHFSIHLLLIKSCTCSIIILGLYVPYCGFLYHTGFAFPVSMDNLYPRIVSFAPSLQKQPQHLFTIDINCYCIYDIILLFNLICLCSSSLCSLSLNVIKFVWLPYSHVCLGIYNAFLYYWKSNTPLSILFS